MGIGKIVGEYIDEMTEPNGWPEIDESSLAARAQEYLRLRNQVSAVAENWRDSQSQIFGGGVWSGRGADAGNAALEKRIAELNALAEHLGKGYAYLNMVAGIVEKTKMMINGNLQNAQATIQAIRSTPNLDPSAIEEAVKAYVISQHALNTSDILAFAAQIPTFGQWVVPASAVPPTSAPPPQLPAAAPAPPTTEIRASTWSMRSPTPQPRPFPRPQTSDHRFRVRVCLHLQDRVRMCLPIRLRRRIVPPAVQADSAPAHLESVVTIQPR